MGHWVSAPCSPFFHCKDVWYRYGAQGLRMMAEVLRGRQEIPDKFTPSFIQDKLDEDDPDYEAKKAELWEVLLSL